MLLMQDPELMMLDEPVAGMSPREREQTAELLKRISQGPLDRRDRARHGVRAQDRAQGHRAAPGKILAEGSMDAVQNDPKVIDVYLGALTDVMLDRTT